MGQYDLYKSRNIILLGEIYIEDLLLHQHLYHRIRMLFALTRLLNVLLDVFNKLCTYNCLVVTRDVRSNGVDDLFIRHVVQ
jgi:hypothetical protein